MAGEIKRLKFSDGVTVSAPTTEFFNAGSFAPYADIAAYETAKGSAAADGDVFYNTTTDLVQYYADGAWSDMVDSDSTQTVSNKTLTNVSINADNNSISNIDDGDIKVGAGITYDKLATLTANRAIVSNFSGSIIPSSVTTTELEHVSGVTSAIQTQIDSKQDDVITTRGDLVVGDASADAVRLAVGGPGTVLSSDGTDVSWTPAGSGDVSAAANMADNSLIRGDGGVKGVQDSNVALDDSDNMSGIVNLTNSGTTTHSALGTGVVHANASGVLSSSNVVDADVDAAAAIAGTKISPNFGSQNIQSSGNIEITSGDIETTGGALGVGVAADDTTGKLYSRDNSVSIPNMVLVQDSSDTATALNHIEMRVAPFGGTSKRFWAGIEDQGSTANRTARVDTDGTFRTDTSFETSGADYAEMFEWEDGNPSDEDRVGHCVSLVGNLIKIAAPGDTVVGVISAAPSAVGDSPHNWPSKFMRDDYGRVVRGEDGSKTLNPDYDPNQEYTLRHLRPEWDAVGLVGKLRIRKGSETGPNWIKLRDITADIEEWLVK